MLLSMGGQIPFADNVQTLRRGEENTLVVTTSNRSRVSRVKYKELWVFDDYGVEGMPPIVEANEVYRVVDWFNVHSGMKHKETFIITPSRDFIREIVFYPSERLDGEHLDMKDLCAISWLDEEQLQLFETSPTYAKFVVLKEMKGMGIRGTKNGICPKTGKQKHYALKIEFDRREKKWDGRRCHDVVYRNVGVTAGAVRPCPVFDVRSLNPDHGSSAVVATGCDRERPKAAGGDVPGDTRDLAALSRRQAPF